MLRLVDHIRDHVAAVEQPALNG